MVDTHTSVAATSLSVNLRMPVELYEELKARAELDDRSLASLVRIACAAYLRRPTDARL